MTLGGKKNIKNKNSKFTNKLTTPTNLLPSCGQWDRPWLPGSALVLTMGAPTAAPSILAHKELLALAAHQQADNIKEFLSNLPLFSYPHTLNI